MCELIPSILSIKSSRKPFITDITIIRVATPIIMPKKENNAVTDIKPSFLFEPRYLPAIINSNFENIYSIYQFNNITPPALWIATSPAASCGRGCRNYTVLYHFKDCELWNKVLKSFSILSLFVLILEMSLSIVFGSLLFLVRSSLRSVSRD